MMRRYILLYISLFLQVAVFAQNVNSNGGAIADTSSVTPCNVYKTILSGVESKIKDCFRVAPIEVLNCNECCTIASAVTQLIPKDKVSHTLWILEEIKNRPADIRAAVYVNLLKVEYSKPNFFIKTMINNYFTNYQEPDDSLAKQVRLLHKNMIK